MTKANGLTTVVVGPQDAQFPRRVVWVGRVEWGPDITIPDVPSVISVTACGETRYINASTLEKVAPDIWQGTRFFFEDDDIAPDHVSPILIRPTIPDDAITGVSFDGGLKVSMPVPVMDYLINVKFGPVRLMALTEDDGYVATMMLDSEPGIYIRYSGAWHQIVDTDVIDGLSVHEVDAGALDMFDQYDRAGQLVPITAMPLEGIPIIQQARRAPTNPNPVTDNGVEAVTAGGKARKVPTLNSLDDLPDAINAGAKNPEIRWWVERRAKALGATGAKFPW